MAKKRMFSLDIVDTDKFLDMPATTQSLYFHLGVRADDEGFVSSPRKIVTLSNCGMDDLRLLASKGYIIPFESGVIVITDWHINNWVRPDRRQETVFLKEKSMLDLTNGSYALSNKENRCVDTCQPSDCQMSTGGHTQYSIDKNSIDNINTNSALDNAPSLSPTKAEINDFFESIWKLYPNKRGKSKIKFTTKKELYRIGYEEMSRAIERYKADLKKTPWKNIQNGSTFFHGSYIDYLDANCGGLDMNYGGEEQVSQDMARSEEEQRQRDYDENQKYLNSLFKSSSGPTEGDIFK